MTRTAKPIPNNAKELKDEATDKELSAEIVKSGKPAKRLGGRWNKGFEQRNEIERPLAPRGGGKAEAEHVFRPGNVGKVEEYRGRGHTKLAGKHVSADGLVSRGGQRRIPPAWLLEDTYDREEWAENAELLNTVAKQTLRGRNATIFEKLVINPVLGRPSGTVDELARQFGVAPARIYRIKDKIKRQMTMAVEKHKAGVSFDPNPRGSRGPTPVTIWLASEDQLPSDAVWLRRGKYSDAFCSGDGRYWMLYRVLRK